MTCKLSGLFSLGEDFDDEDLLGTVWPAPPASVPADAGGAVSSCALRAPSASRGEPTVNRALQAGKSSAGAGLAVARSLEQGGTGLRPSASALGRLQKEDVVEAQQKSSVAQDDFDDWDINLADLEECDSQTVQPPPLAPPAGEHATSAKSLRPPACAGIQRHGELGAAHGLADRNLSARVESPNPGRPWTPADLPGLNKASVTPLHSSRTVQRLQQPVKSFVTPGPSHRAPSLFETISPASTPALSPHPLRTPVLTNRLVQLVSASSKVPRQRPRSFPCKPLARRFPGPAGLLPQQPQGQSLDQIVVSVPQMPAHGAVARVPDQGSSSQMSVDEFSGGGWAAMKAEMGLDERNPSCFLHSYSVVMVLRKAALKQLVKNKVPNMAVQLKSIVHTHADAKAVFRDPTGEIQGTVHRQLLEDRASELKVGAILLLKQVGVFSPSHRNHYLNVTPNNMLRIYSPEGDSQTSSQLPPLVLEPGFSNPAPQAPVSRMRLLFDEDDAGEQAENDRGQNAHACTRGRQEAAGNSGPQDSGWGADDGLDELLGELPEDTYTL